GNQLFYIGKPGRRPVRFRGRSPRPSPRYASTADATEPRRSDCRYRVPGDRTPECPDTPPVLCPPCKQRRLPLGIQRPPASTSLAPTPSCRDGTTDKSPSACLSRSWLRLCYRERTARTGSVGPCYVVVRRLRLGQDRSRTLRCDRIQQ